MHSSAVLALAFVAAATPALSAPAPYAFSRRQTPSAPSVATTDDSGALAINTGLIKDVIDIGNGIITGADGIKQLFQRDEFLEFVARQTQVQNSTDPDSAALNISSIFSIGSDIIQGLSGLFGSSGSSNNKREELLLLARQAATGDQSAALSLGSLFGNIIHGISGLLGSGSGQSQKRDELLMLARQVQAGDQSAALSLGSLFGTIINGLSGLLDGSSSSSKRREVLEMIARQTQDDPSGAISLSSIADIGKIGGDIISGITSLFGSDDNNNQRRELLEMIARQAQDDSSEAISLSSIADVAKIGGDVISAITSLFGGDSSSNNNSRRELEEVFARAVAGAPAPATSAATPTSTATAKLVLPTTASGAIDISSIISTVAGFLPLFFKREELELLARDVPVTPSSTATANLVLPTDASGALDIGKIASTIAGFLPLFFKREELELLARDVSAAASTVVAAPSSTSTAKLSLPTDASGAIDIGKIAETIAGFLPLFFKREELELLARDASAATPSSTSTAKLTLPTDVSGALDIGKIASTIAGFLPLFFKREELELMAREPFVIPSGSNLAKIPAFKPFVKSARSLNDLD